MNPPSHLLINAAIRRWVAPASIRSSAFLLGAILPDIPLTLLWIGAYVYEHYIRGDSSVRLMDERFDKLYFTDPLWIISYNGLHAPLILLAVLALLWPFRAALGTHRHWLFWLAAGCLVHSMLDIPVHVHDGPLLLFPFDWNLRFHSPVSYWDRRYYGREFGLFEIGLDSVLLLALFGPKLWQWLQKRMRF